VPGAGQAPGRGWRTRPSCPTVRPLTWARRNNDIHRALDDVTRAGRNGDPNFLQATVTIGHLVEALDSLNASQQTEEVRKLMGRLARKSQAT
jgi:hypothetical protein